MAGGGIAGAITSLKNNRNLLKKRNRKNKGDVYGREGVTKLNLKQSTEQDMRIIRKKIAEHKRQERRIWVVTIILTLLILYGVYVWLFIG